jgi:hypothetical protein
MKQKISAKYVSHLKLRGKSKVQLFKRRLHPWNTERKSGGTSNENRSQMLEDAGNDEWDVKICPLGLKCKICWLDSRDLEIPFRDFPIFGFTTASGQNNAQRNPRKQQFGVSIGIRMACLFVCFGDLELSHLKPNATTRLPIGERLPWNMSR